MGSIKKIRKKYQTPSHPWQKERIEEEKKLIREYGLKNKSEIWRMASKMIRFKALAKQYITSSTEQSKKEAKQLLDKLKSLGLLTEGSMLNDVLVLSTKDIMERRLQTVMFRNGLSNSVKQARQFIGHGHVKINDIKICSPSYIVKKSDEDSIEFMEKSSLKDLEHPERSVQPSKRVEKRAAELEKRDKRDRRDRKDRRDKRDKRDKKSKTKR